MLSVVSILSSDFGTASGFLVLVFLELCFSFIDNLGNDRIVQDEYKKCCDNLGSHGIYAQTACHDPHQQQVPEHADHAVQIDLANLFDSTPHAAKQQKTAYCPVAEAEKTVATTVAIAYCIPKIWFRMKNRIHSTQVAEIPTTE